MKCDLSAEMLSYVALENNFWLYWVHVKKKKSLVTSSVTLSKTSSSSFENISWTKQLFEPTMRFQHFMEIMVNYGYLILSTKEVLKERWKTTEFNSI